MTFHVPEQFRLKGQGQPGMQAGAFLVRSLRVIAHDGRDAPPGFEHLGGWEHVSVSLPDRCPTWAEMCAIKALFWDPEDCVVQYHPPESDYVNCHPYCLHLWRPIDGKLPVPPRMLVGPKR